MYLVERSPDINRTVLNDHVDHLRDGCGEVRIRKLRMEEDLRAKESLIAYVHFEWLQW